MRRQRCELIKGERRCCCQCLKENKSQTPCTWTCTGRLSATKSRMHQLRLFARWTEAHPSSSLCSAPSLDQASTILSPPKRPFSRSGAPRYDCGDCEQGRFRTLPSYSRGILQTGTQLSNIGGMIRETDFKCSKQPWWMNFSVNT